ncbi:MAG: hypothetical protein QOJ29_1108 [Thermoleophilaceae bacterium]|nr:hypothetical protein [Thermoleophilaceae bacterium]
MARFGERPSGSTNQGRFIAWLQQKFAQIPGMRLDSLPYAINRWTFASASLSAGGTKLPLAGPVPYAKPTPAAGTTGQVVYVPVGTALTDPALKGKIVVRDAPPGTIPFAAFKAVEWFEWDPDGSLAQDQATNYERDFIAYTQRITDLQDAAKAGAAGLVFVHGFPRAQVHDQYAPYEGTRWDIPAVYVGADEGAKLQQLAAKGGSATLQLAASDDHVTTPTLVATLPGATGDRFVVESHTDGMNAIWDNGPIAILQLARYFAKQPLECRPRTLQFVFTTGHLYQRLQGGDTRGGGAELYAQQLDKDYDAGNIALVFTVEHLGAREYAAMPRDDGGPGRVLRQTGRSEASTWFAGESPALIGSIDHALITRDVRRSYLLRGSDVPAAKIPVHNSFGGEGTEYQQHLLPAISLVTGPWTLYNPAFGMEAVDGELMRKQALVFADLIQGLADKPSPVLAGAYSGYRAARTGLCASGLATMGFTRCEGDPYG